MTRTEETLRVGICEAEAKGPFPKQVRRVFAINTLKRIGIYTTHLEEVEKKIRTSITETNSLPLSAFDAQISGL